MAPASEGAAMKRLIETIVRRLSDSPDEIRVSEGFEGRNPVYDVSVPEPDRGRLIGREGRTVKAIRSIMFVAGHKHGKRYHLDLVED